MAKEYFSHDYNSRVDHKIKALISKHGYEGYGLFWAIIEDLYNNANALPTHFDLLAVDLKSNEKTIESIIKDFGLFKIKGKIFFSQSVQDRLNLRNKKSLKAKESADYRWKKDNANALPTQSDRNAIKEKKIKVNNIKLKEKRKKENLNSDFENAKEIFENFRKNYPGTKNGLEKEFKNFQKHSDWKDSLSKLSDALGMEKIWRIQKTKSGGFVPEWKHLATWINQRCWEQELAKIQTMPIQETSKIETMRSNVDEGMRNFLNKQNLSTHGKQVFELETATVSEPTVE